VDVTDRELDIAAEIRRIARDDLGLAPELADSDELAGRLDSLALLSLVVAVEDRWRFRITEEDAAGAKSLADLAAIVARKGQAAATPAGAAS
jgi:acyl carrier protein